MSVVDDPEPDPPADPPVVDPAPTEGSDDADGDADEIVSIPKSLLAKLRHSERENKRLAKEAQRASDLDRKLQEIADSEKTELEKAQARVAEMEQAQEQHRADRRQDHLELAVHRATSELGLADADVALALIRQEPVEYGDDDRPTNVTELLTDLAERKPLLKATQPSGGAGPRRVLDGDGGTRRTPPPQLTQEEIEAAKALGYTDPAEYVRDRDHRTMDAWVGAKPAGQQP